MWKQMLHRKSFWIFFVLLILYGIRLYQVRQEFSYIKTEKYGLGEIVQERGLEFEALEFRETTLEELEEKYGKIEEDFFYRDKDVTLYFLTIRIKNLTEEERSYKIPEIRLGNDYWYTQVMREFVWPINGEEASLSLKFAPQEEIVQSYVYLTCWDEIGRGHDKYMRDADMYLSFRMDDTKRMLLVKEGSR